MPEHIDSGHRGKITWLGRLPDRGAGLRCVEVPEVSAEFRGILGDSHAGDTRASCSRTKGQHPPGTTIRNTRQLTVLCAEDLVEIAREMGIDALDPALIGANMVLSGIPDFSHVPPSSRLIGPSGATLVVDVTNLPCVIPGQTIDADLPQKGRLFKPAARGRRGVTAWVLCEGNLKIGDPLALHIPKQRNWRQQSAVPTNTARNMS